MSAIELSPSQRKQHRAAAQRLHPVVAIGHEGASAAVLKELDTALAAHGLIKVRVFDDDRTVRQALLVRLADELDAAPIQHIGKLLVLWRAPAPKERAQREERKPGPRLVKLVKFSKSGNHRPQVKKIKLLGNQRIAAGGSIKRAKKTRLRSVKRNVID
jgi:putative YhbY family RNA-binding protein